MFKDKMFMKLELYVKLKKFAKSSKMVCIIDLGKTDKYRMIMHQSTKFYA